MKKFEISYTDSRGEGARMRLFAMTADDALSAFRNNVGPHPEAKVEYLRDATDWEVEQINNAGAPSHARRGGPVEIRIPKWNVEAETGYKPITTFWQDFSVADRFGIEAIKDTYARAFEEWKLNCEYLTELVMVLNHKIWQHYKPSSPDAMKLSALYDALWREADAWAMENLKDEELDYYLQTLD